MQIKRHFRLVAHRAMFDEKTRAVDFLVPMETGNAKRVGLYDDVRGPVQKQLVCDARHNAQTGAQFEHAVSGLNPPPDQIPLILLVIPPEETRTIAHGGNVPGNGKGAAIGVKATAPQVEKQSLRRANQELVELPRQRSQGPAKSLR